jgi:hypothetical protein
VIPLCASEETDKDEIVDHYSKSHNISSKMAYLMGEEGLDDVLGGTIIFMSFLVNRFDCNIRDEMVNNASKLIRELSKDFEH